MIRLPGDPDYCELAEKLHEQLTSLGADLAQALIRDGQTHWAADVVKGMNELAAALEVVMEDDEINT